MDETLTFENIRPRVNANLKRRRQLIELLDREIIAWGGRLRKLSYLPGYLEGVHLAGQEKLPGRDRPAPIMAFSHKKAHDVWVLTEYFLGRPLHQFHDITAVIQAGVHSPIYPWRDVLPDFWKRHARRPALFAAKTIGARLTALFEKLHTFPVFREGLDVPKDAAAFEAELAGTDLLGMAYDEFQRYANRTTMQSVVAVQKEMAARNANLVIAPEGRYRLDGSVGEIQALLGMVALRKEREAYLLSLSYDELCPDRLGRIKAFINISDALPAPASKRKIDRYLREVREILQTGTVATASHLIAACLRVYLEAGREFTRAELERDLAERCAGLAQSNAPRDPGVDEAAYRSERLARFWRKFARRWFDRRGRHYRVNPERIEDFAESERTVNDIQWNCNNLVHLPGMAAQSRERGGQSWLAWLRGLG